MDFKKCGSNEKGNALFLILIAVVLFAALSYAVTATTRGSGGIGREQAMLKAAEIASYLGEIRNAVSRLKLANQCTDEELNFEGSGYVDGPTGPYGGNVMIADNSNPHSPSSKSCNVFHTLGGGVSPRVIDIPNPPAAGWTESGNIWFSTEIIPGIGTAEPDLVAAFPRATPEICFAFNAQLGISSDAGLGDGDWFNTNFEGTYDDTGSGVDPTLWWPSGYTMWCHRSSAAPDRATLYLVLLER